VTSTTCAPAVPSAPTAPTISTVETVPAEYEGWQALAVASLDRRLSEAELAAVERLPADIALDLLFPDLTDAARHEALWALG